MKARTRILLCFIALAPLRFDELLLAVPYPLSAKTPETPRYETWGGHSPLFQAYLKEFDLMFSLAEER